MPRLFIFAIGGTGARVLRSLTLLLAAGIQPKDGQGTQYEIIPLIIDPDGANGNVAQTMKLLDNYRSVRKELDINPSNDCFFNGVISELSSLSGAAKSQGLEGYKLLIPNVDGSTFGQFIGYNQLSVKAHGGDGTKEFLEVLYTKKNLETSLEIGFQGYPNMGAVVLNQFGSMPAFQSFANAFNQGDRMFIISSIFGGTGAAGFPLLVKNLRSANPNLPKFSYINQAPLGAVAVQPYFNLPNSAQSPIDSKQFITKTKAALSYYESNLRGLNSLYYIGDEPQSVFENNPGGAFQKNQAHFVELVSALSIIDFLQNSNDQVIDNDHREFGTDQVAPTLHLTHLSRQTQDIINKPLTKFWLLIQYLKNELDSNNNAFNEPFYTTSPNISKITYSQTPFFKILNELTNEYHIWLDEMKKSQIGFEPFKGVVFDKIFDSVEGFKGKRKFLHGRDGNHIVKAINDQASNHRADSIPNKFIKGVSSALNEIIKEKIF